MIHIAICDDNKILLEKYQMYIQESIKQLNINMQIDEMSSGETLLEQMSKEINKYQIIYLDIQMSGKNGIETAEMIRTMGYEGEIIFLTSSEEYIFESFIIHPFAYLMKDETNQQKFTEILHQALQKCEEQEHKRISIMTSDGIREIAYRDILYMEQDHDDTVLMQVSGKQVVKQTLGDIMNTGQTKNFAYIQETLVVNLAYVSEINEDVIVLTKQDKSMDLSLNKKYAESLKMALMQYKVEGM